MFVIKTFTISLVLFLIQGTFAKPVENSVTTSTESSKDDEDFTAKDTLLLFTATNFLLMGIKYVEKSVNISRDILKDEQFLANNEPEVLEFKKELNTFLEDYAKDKDIEKHFDLLKTFAAITDHYLELPKEKETAASKFILEILNKHHIKISETEFFNDFDEFLKLFSNLFELAKDEFDKPFLEWYDKLKATTNSLEKLEVFDEFAELIS